MSRLRAVLAGAVVSLFLVGVAGAAGPGSFTDPVGDAGSGLDITGLNVSEYEGELIFQVTVADRLNWDEDGPLVALDLDQNPDTGSAYYGTEVEVAFVGGGNAREGEPVLRRASGWDFRGVRPPEGWGWGLGPHEVDFFLSRSYLGLGPNAGFNVVAAAGGSHPDTAPDIRTFNYQPVPGTPPPVPGPDSRAPHAITYPASAVHGKVARLTYWVLDGRGRTGETIRIYRRSRLLKTIRIPLRDSSPFDLSHISWRVPRNLRGRIRLSVRSVDAAGNVSKVSWARLAIH